MEASETGTFKVKAGRIVFCKCLRPTDRIEGSKKYNAVTSYGRREIVAKPVKEKKVKDVDEIELNPQKTIFLKEATDCEPEKKLRLYKVNKKEVWSRTLAMYGLAVARKNLTLMTVSFPKGMNDDSIFKCWNTYLTRLRKKFKFRLYLWITERQKNGTLHYHCVVPQWIPIQEANAFMRTCIDNELTKNPQDGVTNWKDKYNGVDCTPTQGNQKRLTSYLTKYIMKSSATFTRLAWHCSHTVSNLFITYDAPYWGEVQDLFDGKLNILKIFYSDFADVMYYDDIGIDLFVRTLNIWNELVYELSMTDDSLDVV